MILIAKDRGLTHLVQKDQDHFELALLSSEIMLRDLNTYIKYPASTILRPNQAGLKMEASLDVSSFTFANASEKATVLKKIESQLRFWKLRQLKIQEILFVADEMFTNAIFNAPHSKFESGYASPSSSLKDAEGQAIKAARLFLVRDQQRILLGCTDDYGSLNPATLLNKLHLCFSKGVLASINWEKGGAGIGTYMILQAAEEYYVGVHPNKATVVCCTFSNSGRGLERGPGIHISTLSGN